MPRYQHQVGISHSSGILETTPQVVSKTLLDFYHLCPGVPAEHNMANGTCPNMYQVNDDWVWTNLISQKAGKTFCVHMRAAQVNNDVSIANNNEVFASCE